MCNAGTLEDWGEIEGIQPKDYSEKNIEWTTKYQSAKFSLEDLRHMQSLIVAQQKLAFEQKNTKALANLQVMEKITAGAIELKEFKEKE